VNITVVEPDGTTTKLNEGGPRLTSAERDALVAETLALARPGMWVVGCGSLPPGLGGDFYAALVARARERGARVAVDSSGQALRLAVSAAPDLVKPNREELAEVSGITVATLGDAVRAAARLRALGAVTVLASLGPDGAVLVDSSGAAHGQAWVAAPRSTVGAGDALLAGYLASQHPGREALACALAWGGAAAGLPGSRMPTPYDVAAVAVTVHDHLDRNRHLDGDT
jgi:1-phosphofructokinase